MPRSLVFIADISGFTRFVNETEITHSRHIISELLEALIEAQILGMEVAEIEGDAILFYKYGQVPKVEELIDQSRSMFMEFHAHLLNYKYRRICNCGACSTAEDLTLKFVSHATDFNFIKVLDRRKPHGPGLVISHRLLKNDVPGREYLLMTNDLIEKTNFQSLESIYPWAEFATQSSEYDDIGDIRYAYVDLSVLRDQVEVKQSIYPELTPDPIVIEDKVDLESGLLFELITNFDFREQWNNTPLSLEYESDKVNRVGTRHVCVFENENIEFETVSNDFGPNKLVYGERLKDYKFVKEATNYFILEGQGASTLLRIESHIRPKNALIKLFSPFYRSVFRKNIKKVFNDISKASRRVKSRGLHVANAKDSTSK